MLNPVLKSTLITLAMLLPLLLIVSSLVRAAFHDTMRDLGFSEKECAGWSDFPII